MTSPLLGSLAAEVGKAFGGLFLPAILTRATPIAGADAWTPGAPSSAAYPCKAIHDQWSAGYLAQGAVKAGEAKLLILAASLPFQPEPGDVVTIRGEAWTIVSPDGGKGPVETDPAKAIWTCRASR